MLTPHPSPDHGRGAIPIHPVRQTYREAFLGSNNCFPLEYQFSLSISSDMDAAWGTNELIPTINSDVSDIEPLEPVVSFSGLLFS